MDKTFSWCGAKYMNASLAADADKLIENGWPRAAALDAVNFRGGAGPVCKALFIISSLLSLESKDVLFTIKQLVKQHCACTPAAGVFAAFLVAVAPLLGTSPLALLEKAKIMPTGMGASVLASTIVAAAANPQAARDELVARGFVASAGGAGAVLAGAIVAAAANPQTARDELVKRGFVAQAARDVLGARDNDGMPGLLAKQVEGEKKKRVQKIERY